MFIINCYNCLLALSGAQSEDTATEYSVDEPVQFEGNEQTNPGSGELGRGGKNKWVIFIKKSDRKERKKDLPSFKEVTFCVSFESDEDPLLSRKIKIKHSSFNHKKKKKKKKTCSKFLFFFFSFLLYI